MFLDALIALQAICRWLRVREATGTTAFLGKLVAGAGAGVAYWVVGLPLDHLKTVVQNRDPRSRDLRWAGFALLESLEQSCLVLRERGVVSLFRGSAVAFGRGVPSAVVTLLTYDTSRGLLEGARVPAALS